MNNIQGSKSISFEINIDMRKYKLSYQRSTEVQTFQPNKNKNTVFILINTHAPISTHSSTLVVFTLHLVYFYLLYKSICCGYSFELPR